MANYAINGFGRIGRNVLRAMTQKQVEQVLAINDLTDTHTLAHLLKWDSVHGKFDGEIGYDDENIIVRGHKIKILKERDPAQSALEETRTLMSCSNRPASSPAATRPNCTLQRRRQTSADQRAGQESRRDDLHRCERRRLRSGEALRSFPTRAAPRIVSRRWRRCCTTSFGIAEWFHEHDPQLHERPAHPRFAARRFAAGAGGGDQHHSVQHGRSQGDRRSDSGIERQTEWRRVSASRLQTGRSPISPPSWKKTRPWMRSMPRSKKLRRLKATRGCSNTATNRWSRTTSSATRTPAFSTAN